MPLTPVLTSTGLIGGFAVAQRTGHRHWGGIVAATAGLTAMEICRRRRGLGRAVSLGSVYAAALAGSHPLAKKMGAWPAVLSMTAGTAITGQLLARPQR